MFDITLHVSTYLHTYLPRPTIISSSDPPTYLPLPHPYIEAVHAASGLTCLHDLIAAANTTIAAVKRSQAESALMGATATATVENFSALVAAVVGAVMMM